MPRMCTAPPIIAMMEGLSPGARVIVMKAVLVCADRWEAPP